MIEKILELAIKEQASDIHLVTKLPPNLRRHGHLYPITDMGIINELKMKEIVSKVVPDLKGYEEGRSFDFAYEYNGQRFRVNAFKSLGTDTLAMRLIPTVIPKVEELHLPEIIKTFTQTKNGLILVTGTTGSGKSTTLASVLNIINYMDKKRIITFEDPVEFIYPIAKCVISQREIGKDVKNFSDAIRQAMRQDPDIILLGEMRDLDTIQNAITAAETGHLVFATLHSKSCPDTIDRIIDVFPERQQEAIRIQLASVLQAVVSQQLIPKKGDGRVPNCEIMIVNDAIRGLIRERGKPNAIRDQIQMNHQRLKSQTVTQSLAQLYKKGLITWETAVQYSEENEEVLRRMTAS